MNWETNWIEGRSRITPDKVAVLDVESGCRWTYQQLNERSEGLAKALQDKGVEKGDRVALLAPNHISYLDLIFACGKIGAVLVPLNWRLSAIELTYIINDCKPELIVFHDKFAHLCNQIHAPCAIQVNSADYNEMIRNKEIGYRKTIVTMNDPLAIIYTGGTTGKPKGVVLTHQSIGWNALNTIVSWGLTSEEVTLTYLPMFHTGGLNALTIPILMMGGTVIIGQQFEPVNTINLINKEHCTIVLLVPTMYHMMICSPQFSSTKFPTMKTFLAGGAPCPHSIYQAFRDKGVAFKEGYGLTEAGPNNFFIEPDEALLYPGSVGKPMMYNTVRIVDDSGKDTAPGEAGELLIQGRHVFDHYWKNEDATKEVLVDGWLHTGDLAKRNHRGYHFILGRKKDMIITGGENVFPLEVEQQIDDHPKVSEVAVVGLPHEKWGEVVTAFIVTKAGEKVTEEELNQHCEKKLGHYKLPKKYFFVDELPKTDVGKIDKKTIINKYRVVT